MSVIRRILVYYKFSMRINQARSHQVRDLMYLSRFIRVEDLQSIEVFPIIPRYSIMFAAFALASPDSNMIAELVHQLNKASRSVTSYEREESRTCFTCHLKTFYRLSRLRGTYIDVIMTKFALKDYPECICFTPS